MWKCDVCCSRSAINFVVSASTCFYYISVKWINTAWFFIFFYKVSNGRGAWLAIFGHFDGGLFNNFVVQLSLVKQGAHENQFFESGLLYLHFCGYFKEEFEFVVTKKFGKIPYNVHLHRINSIAVHDNYVQNEQNNKKRYCLLRSLLKTQMDKTPSRPIKTPQISSSSNMDSNTNTFLVLQDRKPICASDAVKLLIQLVKFSFECNIIEVSRK